MSDCTNEFVMLELLPVIFTRFGIENAGCGFMIRPKLAGAGSMNMAAGL